MNDVGGFFNKMKEEEQRDTEALAAAQKKFTAVSAGLFSNDQDGGDATLQDQLIRKLSGQILHNFIIMLKACNELVVHRRTEIKGTISQAETDRKQSEMQIKHNKEQLKKKEGELQESASSFTSDKQQLEKLEREISAFKV